MGTLLDLEKSLSVDADVTTQPMGARFCHSIFQPKNLIVDLGELIEEAAAAKEELFGFLVH